MSGPEPIDYLIARLLEIADEDALVTLLFLLERVERQDLARAVDIAVEGSGQLSRLLGHVRLFESDRALQPVANDR